MLVRELCQLFSAPLPPDLDTIKVSIQPYQVIFPPVELELKRAI